MNTFHDKIESGTIAPAMPKDDWIEIEDEISAVHRLKIERAVESDEFAAMRIERKKKGQRQRIKTEGMPAWGAEQGGSLGDISSTANACRVAEDGLLDKDTFENGGLTDRQSLIIQINMAVDRVLTESEKVVMYYEYVPMHGAVYNHRKKFWSDRFEVKQSGYAKCKSRALDKIAKSIIK